MYVYVHVHLLPSDNKVSILSVKLSQAATLRLFCITNDMIFYPLTEVGSGSFTVAV